MEAAVKRFAAAFSFVSVIITDPSLDKGRSGSDHDAPAERRNEPTLRTGSLGRDKTSRHNKEALG